MSLTLATALTIALIQKEGVTEPRLLRYPSIHGDTVVYSYAGDLWVSDIHGGMARRLTTSAGTEVLPKISPDGKWVAFTGQYDGNADVYVIPIEGGEPKRLTYEPEPDSVVGWTPDGKIAYTSSAGSFIARQSRLWYVKPEGGLPISTPLLEAATGTFSEDGKTFVYNRQSSYNFNWRRYRGGTQGKVSIYNFETNKYSELPTGREQNYFPMLVGKDVFYTSDKRLGTQNLYRYNLDTKKEVQLTEYADADVRFPNTDGKTIVFERDGILNTYDIANKKVTKLAPKMLSEFLYARPYLRPLGDQITSISLSPSGARVVAEARGDIFSIPAKSGDTRNLTETSGVRERFPDWSPDGKSIAYLSDATGDFEVYVKPSAGGAATQLTKFSGIHPEGVEFSPDSKKLMVPNLRNELWIIDIAEKKSKMILSTPYGFTRPVFSPDSKWLALTVGGKNGFSRLSLLEVATGKLTPINSGMYDDNAVTWDLNGKFLYFTSTRTFQPTAGAYEYSLKVDDPDRVYILPLTKDTPNPLIAPNEEEPTEPSERPSGRPGRGGPGGNGGGPGGGGPAGPPAPDAAPEVKIDFDGISSRALPLPMGPSRYPMIEGGNNGLFFISRGNLARYDLQGREVIPVLPNILGGIAFNASHSKVALYVRGELSVVELRPGLQPGTGKVDTSAVEMLIQPRDEWKQMFWESWRFTRDHFYDAKYRGRNWKAIGDHYATFLPYVNHRSDLNYLLGLLIGELGTGHSYVVPGDPGPTVRPIPVGCLGADYELVGKNIKFKRIYRGENFEETRRGPLGEPGVDVKDNDFLLEIDGVAVTDTTHPNSLLQNKVGRFVTLTVNSTPTMTGSRKVRVRPIASEANLRYITFVADTAKAVEKASGGRIGYMHVPSTQTNGAVEFIRGYYSQTDKDALIVDERWNSGGFIQPWFADTLARKSKAGIAPRNSPDQFDAVAIEGPKVMLINGYAGSGGDFFPWLFRQAKLGPLVGTRTWGGLVGISSPAPLVDGGGINAPSFAIFDRETGEIIAENTGVDPDIEVDARPDLVAQGKDPQLEKAIEILMAQLKKVSPTKTRTEAPKVAKPGQVDKD